MFDVGATYDLPFYTQEQYYVGRQRAALFVGGRNTFSIEVFLIRLNFYVDFWPVKATVENYTSYDLLGTSGLICNLGTYMHDVLRALLYFQLDYQDCGYGVFGLALQTNEKPIECAWLTYYVNKPLLDWVIASESTSELYRTAGCEDRVIPRFDA